MLTIYKASAGSGKTYTLAYEYIKLLLGRKLESGRYVLNHKKYLGSKPVEKRPHSHILAITFTNKATAEMKTRIIKELNALGYVPAADEEDAAYAAALLKEFGCSREELASVATESLRRLLHDYGAFNISTIDAFFQTILRTFAREIDRQGDYRVELEREFVIGQAMAMLFDDVNDGSDDLSDVARHWLQGMAMDNFADGGKINPFDRDAGDYESLSKSVIKSLDGTFDNRAAEIREYLSDPERIIKFKKRLKELDKELLDAEKAAAGRVVAQLNAEGYDIEKVESSVRKLLKNSLDGVGGFDKDSVDKIASPPKYIEALELRDPGIKSPFLKTCKASEAAFDLIYGWFDVAKRSIITREVYRALDSSVNALRVLSFINDYITKFRLENNLILLDDTNSLLGSIISKSDAPFIYERVGVELRNFLIDEFQDTSLMQWDNIKPLLDNSLSTDEDSLIIGDVKQSIYRWRGGDRSLLGHTVAECDFPHQHVIKGAGEGENTNYRSAHDLVRFNNALFYKLAAAHHVDGYEGVAQSLPGNTEKLSAKIRINNLQSDELLDKFFEQLSEEERANIAEDKSDLPMYLTGREILEQHRRGYEWRDIAVLVRTNNNGVKIAQYLLQHFPEIKIKSDEALLLRNCPSVRVIISMLEVVDKAFAGELQEVLPADAADNQPRGTKSRRQSMIMMNRFEYFVAHGSTIEDALEKALDFDNPTSDIQQDDQPVSLSTDLDAIRKMAPANLVGIVEAIIQLKIDMAQRREDQPYINTFVDTVIDYSENYLPTVHSFLEYWNDRIDKLAITAGADEDAVTIMTMHKAKGLEWNCVHIPLMNWRLAAGPEPQWFSLDGFTEIDEEIRPPMMYVTPNKTFAYLDESCPLYEAVAAQIGEGTADNLNVAYVAFTRAVRELDVNFVKSKSGDMAKVLVDTLGSDTAPDSDIYVNTAELTDADGNFAFGEPTYPIVKQDDEPKKKKACPEPEVRPIGMLDYRVAFTALNQQVTRIDDLVTDSREASDPDVGNDTTLAAVDTDDDFENLDPEERERIREAAKEGLTLHAILENTVTISDLDEALARRSKYLEAGEIEHYRELLVDAIEAAGEYGKLWFDPEAPRILTECGIFDPVRDVHKRLDRLVWTTEGTIDIVDYKFTSQAKSIHADQVRDYADYLTQMGYENIRAFVWYPVKKKIIRVL